MILEITINSMNKTIHYAMFNFLKFNFLLFFILLFSAQTKAQDLSLTVGTDFPYEHYVGFNVNVKNFDISYRTGFLVPPYSDVLINSLSIYDVDEIYIDLLEKTFDFGWMNSLGVYYRLGKNKQWYLGPEFRFDFFTASTTPVEVVETVIDRSDRRNLVAIDNNTIETEFGLTTLALSLRAGRTFFLVKDNPHHILNVEIVLHRYIGINSTITIDGTESEVAGDITDELLWENFFKSYGYVPALGVAYTYRF